MLYWIETYGLVVVIGFIAYHGWQFVRGIRRLRQATELKEFNSALCDVLMHMSQELVAWIMFAVVVLHRYQK